MLYFFDFVFCDRTMDTDLSMERCRDPWWISRSAFLSNNTLLLLQVSNET